MHDEKPISKVRLSVFIEPGMRSIIRSLMLTRNVSEGEIVREALLRALPIMAHEETKRKKEREEELAFKDIVGDLLEVEIGKRIEFLEIAIRHKFEGEELPWDDNDVHSNERYFFLKSVSDILHKKELLYQVIPDIKKLSKDDAQRFLAIVGRLQSNAGMASHSTASTTQGAWHGRTHWPG